MLFFANLSFSQSTISGNIISIDSLSLEKVNVILKNLDSNNIIAFTFTNTEGFFKISKKLDSGNFILSITSIGYKTRILKLEIKEKTLDLGKIVLFKDLEELQEIVLESKKKAITIKGDTTIYNVSRFLNGNEDSLKDLITNLPGIQISRNGKIEVNGKEITELLIDGENIYKSQHQFATENLSSKIVKSVEFYKNYTPFDKIKRDSITGDTALNIIIKDEYKFKFKGDAQMQTDFKNRFKINTTLYNLRPTNKLSVIVNTNNLGQTPISIQDYYSLIKNDAGNKSNESSVTFADANGIPKFLTSAENVEKKDNQFVNLSNVYSPTKKLKQSFYMIMNKSKQREILINEQNFIDSNLSFFENSINTERNFFSVFDLKTVYKKTKNDIFILSNNLKLNNITNDNNIMSNIRGDINDLMQSNITANLKSVNNINYSKKINNSLLTTSAFFNTENTDTKTFINSNVGFLDLTFGANNNFSQKSINANRHFGVNTEYNMMVKKSNVSFKINYQHSDKTLNNFSETDGNLSNNLNIEERLIMPELLLNYNISKKIVLNLNANFNDVIQNINNKEILKTSFVGYSTNFKLIFSSNSIFQINRSLSNSLSNTNNLNIFVRDYRTILTNFNLQPNTLFPLHKISINYLKTNPSTSSFVIFNIAKSWSNISQNINIVNKNNYSILENRISPAQSTTTGMIYFDKNLTSIPFRVTFNTDFNSIRQSYFIDSIEAQFKSDYFSNYIFFKSSFKKIPINFDLGCTIVLNKINNNASISSNETYQITNILKGNINRNLFCKLELSRSYFTVNENRSTLNIISPSFRYFKQNTKWEFAIIGHNILNFDSPKIISNQSNVGFQSQLTFLTLPGFINFSIKHKF